MRCPVCGATNPDGAQWCGQCLHRFDRPQPAEPEAEDVAPAAPPAGTSEGFRRQGDSLQWGCPSCGHYNDIDEVHCVICGTAFTERFEPRQEPEPPRNWTAAMALSAVAPGAGHLSVERYGSGAARLILFLTWIAGALLLGLDGGAGALPAVAPLLLGAAAVWAGALVDLQRLSQGQEEFLVGRRLLFLVIGVLALLGVGLLASAMRLMS